MIIAGIVEQLTPIEKVGRKGTSKRLIIVRVSENNVLAVEALGQVVDNLPADSRVEGSQVEVDCTLSSREWNGRWYTSLTMNDLTLK